MKKKKFNKEKKTRVLVYVLCFALVGISLFSLFSVFVGATDSESDTDISVVADCNHYYEYVRSLPELRGTHADVYTCAYCGDTYYEYAIPCEYAVSSVDGVISGYCLSCSQECVHQWKDGHCPVCTFSCFHQNHTIDGTCTLCGMVGGAHYFRNVVHESNGSDEYHTTKKYCNCGYVETDYDVVHTYSNGECSVCGYQCTHSIYIGSVCTFCGYICEHSTTTRYYKSADSDKHIELFACNTCGAYTTETLFYHTIGTDGICTKCGYGCSHSDTYTDYHNTGDKNNHQRIDTCTYCGASFDVSLQAHTLDKNGICSRCTYICRHNNVVIRYEAPVVKENTPVEYYHRIKVSCGDCGIELTSHSQYNAWEKCKYVDGVCSICSYSCTHQRGFENGTCIRCSSVCTHSWNANGICTVCGLTCSHSLIERCVYSTNPEKHPWETYCTICGIVTKTIYVEHQFNSNNKCSCCGFICTHSDFVLNLSFDPYNHTWTKSCAYCSYVESSDTSAHNWNHVGICTDCEYTCSHSLKERCVYSTNPEKHPWETYCTICGIVTKTIYVEHQFNPNNKCSCCGFICTHSSHKNEVCVYCGLECPHDKYASGVCDVCGKVCTHFWQKSTCKICKMSCENHVFTNGSLRCDFCDYYIVVEGYQRDDGFFRLMTAIYDAQVNTYFSLLNYEILGVNIAQFVLAIVTLVIAVIIFKIAKKVI